jgi:hypothetical protein
MHIEVFLQDTAPICTPVSFCNGTRFESEEYLCGDSRLGPKELPTSPPFATLLSGYKRLGGMCPSEFLKKWSDGDFYTFIDPPTDGFQLSPRHKPIADDQVLERGMLVDAFGGYTTPATSRLRGPFALRAVPPLDLNDMTSPCPVTGSIGWNIPSL